MLIDHFYTFSAQGDVLISRTFLQYNNERLQLPETLFIDYLSDQKNVAPVFSVPLKDGNVYFAHIRRQDMIFVLTTYKPLPPSYLIDLLYRITCVFKDFFGVLNEEAILKNFFLAYELLDEIIDFGYPQCTSTNLLKDRIHNFPTPPIDAHFHPINKTLPSTASQRPVVIKSCEKLQKNITLKNHLQIFSPQPFAREYSEEVFIDVVERLNVMQTGAGNIEYATLDGSIVVKNFLKDNPLLKIGLSDHISSIPIEEILFSSVVNYQRYANDQSLEFRPPEGETKLMNYTTSNNRLFKVPLNVSCNIEFIDKGQVNLTATIVCTLLHHSCGPIIAKCPLHPKTTQVSLHANNVAKQTYEYDATNKLLIWRIEGLTYERSVVLSALISMEGLSASAEAIKKQIGPIALTYEVPMFTSTSLQVIYLKMNTINQHFRWIRYVTMSSSHLYRI
ncbi:Adaptor complexes medium subunit family [Babesia microti strain RI]|uniref:Adaptor complexes medium subunit family n=1 Tax=Babesia microti (strain RI) TaxID=1133968 RepID=A0A1R4AAP4_BABMR|nr:Adaptor complexes medium subunit family [Babesia microti strain RI]SJK86079.1 Adaptor complexes medium subunit family [Babesia microti strain RI]|eukprot:XP_021338275.1 Adaptor complexes medium subunit family [Babesia microti strain RI]